MDVSHLPAGLTDARLVTLGLGVLLLAFGRRLYFLLLGIVGFTLGLVAANSAPVQSLELFQNGEARLLLGLVLGVVAASLAFFVHRVALIAGGIGIGGFGGFWLADLTQTGPQGWGWLWVVGGAVLGGVLLHRLFEGALIVLSAWVGTALVVQSLPVQGSLAIFASLGLLALGILFQSRSRRQDRRSGRRQQRRSRRRRRRQDRRQQAAAT